MTSVREHIIVRPSQNDVLFDRRSGTLASSSLQEYQQHSGSDRFREMCKLHNRIAYYFSATNNNRKEITNNHSSIVAYRIIDAIRHLNPPGRFLQRIPLEQTVSIGLYNVWEEIDNGSALEMVKQYLRDDASSQQSKACGIRPSEDEPQQWTLPSSNTTTAAVVNETGPDNDKPDSTTRKELFSLLAMEEYEGLRITEDDIRHEKESLTVDECSDILNDLYGNIGGIHRTNKKCTPTRSVASLVQDMRNEIERIPLQEKTSLVTAQTKADAKEFSDGRLELFLRREGMDPQVCHISLGIE